MHARRKDTEASRAALDLPLAFVRGEDRPGLVAVLSMQKEDNAHIGPKGLWMGDYIPAAVRAHPFAMTTRGGRGVVLVDTASDWLAKDKGAPLFDDQGNPTAVLNNRIQLLKTLGPSPKRDQPGIEAVFVSQILEPWPKSEGPLYGVNPERLSALGDQRFLQLRVQNALSLVYAQLMSKPRINRIKELAERKQGMKKRMGLDGGLSNEEEAFLSPGDDDMIHFDE